MVSVNLLPWRTYQHEYQRRLTRKNLIMISLFICLFVIALDAVLIKNENIISSQITKLNLNLVKYNLIKEEASDPEQITLINSLKQYRYATVSLFKRFVDIVNSGVCFSKIKQDKAMFTFVGKAETAAGLSMFLKNWQLGDSFADIQMDEIRETHNKISFKFRALIKNVV